MKIKVAVTQVALKGSTDEDPSVLGERMLKAHAELVAQAAGQGVQMIGFQEVFNQPYFCPSLDPKWFAGAEKIPSGPTVSFLCDLARKHRIVIVAPLFERTDDNTYYNTAAVIDADGSYLGKYRKVHVRNAPRDGRGIERFYFSNGDLGYPVFDTSYGKVGVYICYDRHFPEGFRALALNGAQIVFNPCATSVRLSQHLWRIEQPAAAVANGFYVCANNRVGVEDPWSFGRFYGSSYIVNPRGEIISMGGDADDEIVTAEIDLALIEKTYAEWNFIESRQASTYGELFRDPKPLVKVQMPA